MGEKMGRPYNECLTYGPQNITTHKNKAIKVFLMTSVYRISQLLFIFLGSLRHVSVLLNAVHIRNIEKLTTCISTMSLCLCHLLVLR